MFDALFHVIRERFRFFDALDFFLRRNTHRNNRIDGHAQVLIRDAVAEKFAYDVEQVFAQAKNRVFVHILEQSRRRGDFLIENAAVETERIGVAAHRRGNDSVKAIAHGRVRGNDAVRRILCERFAQAVPPRLAVNRFLVPEVITDERTVHAARFGNFRVRRLFEAVFGKELGCRAENFLLRFYAVATPCHFFCPYSLIFQLNYRIEIFFQAYLPCCMRSFDVAGTRIFRRKLRFVRVKTVFLRLKTAFLRNF